MAKVFISHSSKNNAVAARLEATLRDSGFEVWLDDSNIQIGVLLGPQLLDSIRSSRCVVLLWSADAARSRWVNMEWLIAFHERRFIIPCVVEGADLPRCMQKTLHLDLGGDWDAVADRLRRVARDPPAEGSTIAPVVRGGMPPALRTAINEINGAMTGVLGALRQRDLPAARAALADTEARLGRATESWRDHPWIATLAGYHLKNVYQVSHWDDIQAGLCPEDPLLDDAEATFLKVLAADPTADGALNGLGNILFFKRDLDAADLFTSRAIDYGKLRRQDTRSYEHDKANIDRFRLVPLYEVLQRIQSAEHVLEQFRGRIEEERAQNRIDDANTLSEVRDKFQRATRMYRDLMSRTGTLRT